MSKQITMHFSTLNDRAKSASFNAAKYATEDGVLREKFKCRFQDFRKHKTYFRIYASPFEVDVEAVPENSTWSSQISRADKKLNKNF
jgi:hypothetical protein